MTERVVCMCQVRSACKPLRAALAMLLSLTLVISSVPVRAIAESDAEPSQMSVESIDGADKEIGVDDLDNQDIGVADDDSASLVDDSSATDPVSEVTISEESETGEITEVAETEAVEIEERDGIEEADKENTSVSSLEAQSDGVEAEEGVNTEIWPDAQGLKAQASSTVDVIIYNSGELRIGTDLSTADMYKGWSCGQDGTFFDQSIQDPPNPWTKYASKVTKVTMSAKVATTNAEGMFRGLYNVTSINVSKLDVSRCSTFAYMYSGCSKLKTLDMSGWSIGSTSIPAAGMYNGCSSLRSVTVGKGFKFCRRLPSYSIDNHTKWYSNSAKKWFTADEIYSERGGIADTYSKSSSTGSRSINNSKVKVSIATQAWTGKQLKPTPTVKWESTNLVKGTHFKVVGYGTNKNAGTTNNWVKIEGIGTYTGTRTVAFTIKKPAVQYRTHVQTYGWQSFVSDGALSGTTGQSKRLEGINIKLSNNPVPGGISYRTHIQTYGWESSWKSNGAMSGTSGQSKRLEAIQIKLTGEMASKYDVWYCVHAQRFGWLGWAKNGASAGTAKYAYRLEAIRIKLLPKGSSKPAALGSTTVAFHEKQLRYQLKRDTWRFGNFSANIPRSFYARCYGASAGYTLYSQVDDFGYVSGVCYGMVSSVGAVRRMSYPSVSSFGSSKIYDIGKNDLTTTLGLTAKEYIEYAHIEQYDYDLMVEMTRNLNNSSGLVSAVRNHMYDGTAVVIDLLGKEANHAVLPLNITRDDAYQTVISVYDPNHPTQAQSITLYKSNGAYRYWKYSDDYSYKDISWETPADNLQSIMNGNGTSYKTKSMRLVSTTSDVTLTSGGKTYRLSSDTTNDLDSVVPIVKRGNATKDAEKLYWVALDSSDVKVSDVGRNTKVTICAERSAVEVSVKEGGLAALSVSDEKGNSASVSGEKGDAFEVTYLEFADESGEPMRTTVSGKVRDGSGVEAFFTPQGEVEVSGAKDVSVE